MLPQPPSTEENHFMEVFLDESSQNAQDYLLIGGLAFWLRQPGSREASGPRPTGTKTRAQGACWTARAEGQGSQARPEVSADKRNAPHEIAASEPEMKESPVARQVAPRSPMRACT
jgi:hypothetical protein